MALFSQKSWDEWISEYGEDHQHPINLKCHTVGIPMIMLSLPMFVATLFFPLLLPIALSFFIVGWILQFIGHYYEKKAPDFLKDWRFLFVGARWWFRKAFKKPL